MIAELLPAVVVVEVYEDSPDQGEDGLFPAERAAISAAVERRRREYTTVRICARRALAQLGFAPAPILNGDRGAPRWPDGAVGSMTHCAGYRAAAVARTGTVTSLGIDAEPHAALPDGVLPSVAGTDERAHLADLATRVPQVHWDRLLFSAKESVYKAWFPRTGRWLGFEDAAVRLSADGTFTARLLGPSARVPGAPADGFVGRWTVGNGLLATAIFT